MNFTEHKKNIAYYTAITLEIIVSGYFNEMNLFWWMTRFAILSVIASAIHTKKVLLLRVIPLVFVFLALSGIREKWHSIAQQKLAKQEISHTTKIKEPVKPRLENCEAQPKYARPECLVSNKDLQTTYAKDLKAYNKNIQNSENDIRKIEIELTSYDQQPIWIYVFLSMACIALSIISTYDDRKPRQVANTNLPQIKIDKNEVVKNYLDTKGKTIETYCLENGIATSTFKRWKNNYETRLKNNETKLRLIKKEIA